MVPWQPGTSACSLPSRLAGHRIFRHASTPASCIDGSPRSGSTIRRHTVRIPCGARRLRRSTGARKICGRCNSCLVIPGWRARSGTWVSMSIDALEMSEQTDECRIKPRWDLDLRGKGICCRQYMVDHMRRRQYASKGLCQSDRRPLQRNEGRTFRGVACHLEYC